MAKKPEILREYPFCPERHPHLAADMKNSARIVKIADLKDHLRPNCPPSKRERYEKAVAMVGGPRP